MAAPPNPAQGFRSSEFIVEPSLHHVYTFILLHGLGSNGKEFGQELLDTGITSDGRKLTEMLPGARFIFPTAKRRRSSAFGRAKLTQWFDIASLDGPSLRRDTQLVGLAESAQEIMNLIEAESSKVSPGNIVLGGLSHGSAMAVACLLALAHPIGGFIGMSGWLPFQHDIEDMLKGEVEIDDDEDPFGSDNAGEPCSLTGNQTCAGEDQMVQTTGFYRDLLYLSDLESPLKTSTSVDTPVFLGHGGADGKIKASLGRAVKEVLEVLGYDVSWVTYESHGQWYKIPDEMDDVVEFLRTKVRWDMDV